MSIPINPNKQEIHRLARELRDADFQLQLALLRRQTLQADLDEAKARAADTELAADQAAAVAEVKAIWGVE
jgi:hypothetical protein